MQVGERHHLVDRPLYPSGRGRALPFRSRTSRVTNVWYGRSHDHGIWMNELLPTSSKPSIKSPLAVFPPVEYTDPPSGMWKQLSKRSGRLEVLLTRL